MHQESLAKKCWRNFNYVTTFPLLTLFWSFRTAGSRHVPATGPVLILANHGSYIDPVLIGLAVRRRTWFMARKTLFRPAFFAWYLRSMNTLPVDQEGVAKEGLRLSVDLLQANQSLLIFPEGERTGTGEMIPFKPGIALILRKAPVPVVPLGIAGAFDAYPRGQLLPRLSPLFWPPTGAAIAVSMGEPIPPSAYQGMERERLLSFLFDKVQEQVRRADKMVRKPA